MNTNLFFGLLAATLTCIVLLPKAITAIRSRDVTLFKTKTLVSLLAACFLWIIYGVHSSAPALVITAVIGFSVTGIMLGFKIQSS